MAGKGEILNRIPAQISNWLGDSRIGGAWDGIVRVRTLANDAITLSALDEYDPTKDVRSELKEAQVSLFAEMGALAHVQQWVNGVRRFDLQRGYDSDFGKIFSQVNFFHDPESELPTTANTFRFSIETILSIEDNYLNLQGALNRPSSSDEELMRGKDNHMSVREAAYRKMQVTPLLPKDRVGFEVDATELQAIGDAIDAKVITDPEIIGYYQQVIGPLDRLYTYLHVQPEAGYIEGEGPQDTRLDLVRKDVKAYLESVDAQDFDVKAKLGEGMIAMFKDWQTNNQRDMRIRDKSNDWARGQAFLKAPLRAVAYLATAGGAGTVWNLVQEGISHLGIDINIPSYQISGGGSEDIVINILGLLLAVGAGLSLVTPLAEALEDHMSGNKEAEKALEYGKQVPVAIAELLKVYGLSSLQENTEVESASEREARFKEFVKARRAIDSATKVTENGRVTYVDTPFAE